MSTMRIIIGFTTRLKVLVKSNHVCCSNLFATSLALSFLIVSSGFSAHLHSMAFLPVGKGTKLQFDSFQEPTFNLHCSLLVFISESFSYRKWFCNSEIHLGLEDSRLRCYEEHWKHQHQYQMMKLGQQKLYWSLRSSSWCRCNLWIRNRNTRCTHIIGKRCN